MFYNGQGGKLTVSGQSMTMRQYMSNHLWLYCFVGVLFVMGVIFGALMVNAMTLEQKEDLLQYLNNFLQTMRYGVDVSEQQSFAQFVLLHMRWIALIWLFGLSVVGSPLILALNFLKGVLIGFSVGYLIGQFSWTGVLFALVSVAPQNLFVIPAIIILSVSGLSFSILLVKNRLLQRKDSIRGSFVTFSLTALAMGTMLIGVAAFEAYVSPALIQMVAPMIGPSALSAAG